MTTKTLPAVVEALASVALRRMNTGTLERRRMPDMVGYVGGRYVERDAGSVPPKRCLSCGRLQNPDGTLDCGH